MKVDPKVFADYVGTYRLTPNLDIVVTTEGKRLYGQATGQPRFEMFSESERQFFLKAVDAQVTFETDVEGRATDLVLHQAGRDVRGRRVS